VVELFVVVTEKPRDIVSDHLDLIVLAIVKTRV
jgi:hypothetical protein